MKIIILGAGQVGGTLAENLVGENNDITIVDNNADRLRELQDKYDLRVVNGHASQDRKSTRLNSSHIPLSRMPSSA